MIAKDGNVKKYNICINFLQFCYIFKVIMDSENEISLRKAIEAEQKKNKELQEKIKQKEEETQKYVIFIQKSELFTDFSGMSKELSRKMSSLQKVFFIQKEYFLNSIENCDNSFKRILQDSLEKLFQEKLILESTLEQEREVIIQTMSKNSQNKLPDFFKRVIMVERTSSYAI